MTSGQWGYPVIAVEGIDGAGKSSLCERLADALGGPGRARVTRLSSHTGALPREMVEDPPEPRRHSDQLGDDPAAGAPTVRHQDVVPAGLRGAAHTVDALVRFSYLDETYRSCRAVPPPHHPRPRRTHRHNAGSGHHDRRRR
jgi:hypothetical protein